MINSVTMEGMLSLKPVLLEGKAGVVTEFNLEHSDFSAGQPACYVWRCKATGPLATTIAERSCKGQRLVVQGRFVQELVKSEETDYMVVKLLVHECSLGPIKVGGGVER